MRAASQDAMRAASQEKQGPALDRAVVRILGKSFAPLAPNLAGLPCRR